MFGLLFTPSLRSSRVHLFCAVQTKFTLEGDVFVQTIEFNQDTAFPVVADPSDFWGWTKCVGVVTAEIAMNALVALKVAKLVSNLSRWSYSSSQPAADRFGG